MPTTTVKVITEVDNAPLSDLKDLITEIITLTGENLTSTFSEATSTITTAVESTTESMDELRQTVDDTAESIENIDPSPFDDVRDSASEVADEMGNVKDNMDDSTDSSRQFSDSVIEWAAVLPQIKEFANTIAGFNDEFTSVNETIGQVAVNTGYTDSQVRELATGYSSVGTSAVDAANYLQRMQNAGLEPNTQAMNTAMDNAHKLQTAFRMSGDEADALMGSLSRAGIGATNLSDSFNALGYISAETNIGVDTFQSILTTSGANMDKYGVSVDVAAVALSKINKNYRSSRQAGSAFNKAVEESQGDVSKLEELLGLEAGTLQNASAETSKAKGVVDDLSTSYEDAQGVVGWLNEQVGDLTMTLSGTLAPVTQFSTVFTGAFSGAANVKATVDMLKELRKIDLSKVTGAVSNFIGTIRDIPGMVRGVVDTFKDWNIVSKLSSIANWELAISEWAVSAPVLILIGIIILLIAYLTYLYFTNEDVRNAINGLGQAFLELGQWIWNTVTQGGQALMDFITFFATLPVMIPIYLLMVISHLLGFKNKFVTGLMNAAQGGVSSFMSYLVSLPRQLANELNNALNVVAEWAATLPQKFWEAGVNAVKNFKNALGIHSPGIIQTSLVNEVINTRLRVGTEGDKLSDSFSDLGTSIITSFGDPSLDYDLNGVTTLNGKIESSDHELIKQLQELQSSSKGDVIFNIDYLAKKEFVNDIIDIIQKELNWNNTTAGRTV